MRQQLGIPGEAPWSSLHVGSGFERKGVAPLLRALAPRREPAWAVVVGRDKRAARYVTLARALGMAERVRFVGGVSDVRPYYAAADAFVLPTLYDPQPNAALEAMACGPAGGHDAASAAPPSCSRRAKSGFVRDALDVAGIAEAIDRLDPPTARRHGRGRPRRAWPPSPREAMGARVPRALRSACLRHGIMPG